MNMKHTKDRVIKNSRHPLLTKFLLEVTERIQKEGKLPYRRLDTNLPRVGWRRITPVVDKVVDDVLHNVIGEDWKGFEDKSLSQYLKVYNSNKIMNPSTESLV